MLKLVSELDKDVNNSHTVSDLDVTQLLYMHECFCLSFSLGNGLLEY